MEHMNCIAKYLQTFSIEKLDILGKYAHFLIPNVKVKSVFYQFDRFEHNKKSLQYLTSFSVEMLTVLGKYDVFLQVMNMDRSEKGLFSNIFESRSREMETKLLSLLIERKKIIPEIEPKKAIYYDISKFLLTYERTFNNQNLNNSLVISLCNN